MNKVELSDEMEKYVERRYGVELGEIICLRFPNVYEVVINKDHRFNFAMVTLFFGIQKLGNLLYFKNNEDLNTFLRETLERK